MLDRLSEMITNAGVPLERVEGVRMNPQLVFQEVATQQQRDTAQQIVAAFDWSEAAHFIWLRAKQKLIDAQKIEEPHASDAVILRAVVETLVDEINILRQWIEAFKTQVAVSTNLGNFQTRVAGLPNLPDRTLQQAKTIITQKIEAGE